ncbi:MAG: PilN domain-containing protein [Nitrospirae bacterium]|nr:PilN domain-containing protein [Nitrospirota bacterium]
MIRINLIARKRGASTKRAIDFRNFLVGVGAALGLVVVAGVVASLLLGVRIADLEAQKSDAEADLRMFKDKAAQIANFETDRKNFQDKIAVIQELRGNQSQPVILLDQVARQMPERAWLTRMEAKGPELTIVGRAMGNSDIVEMMRRFKAIEVLDGLQLVESRRMTDKDLSAYEFTLTGRLVQRRAGS